MAVSTDADQSWLFEVLIVMKVLRGEAKKPVLFIFWVLIVLPLVISAPAGAVQLDRAAGVKDLPAGSIDFDTAARIAIRQSPLLTKSDLEIQIRRLDEKDSKSDFFPAFNFRTQYFVNDVTVNGQSLYSKYSLNFTSAPYSPWEAYFSLQARKLVTKIVILTHLKVISQGLNLLGTAFLQLDTLAKMAQVQQESIQLFEKQLNFMQERQKIGQGSALEIKVASQELQVAKLALKQLLEGQNKYKRSIRAYLGCPPDQELHLDLASSRHQILGRYENLQQFEDVSPDVTIDLKIQAIKKELQKYNIILAKTKMLPTLFVGFQNPDPLSFVQSNSMFFYLGASIPVWDGFKRLRNVSRQKIVLKQVEAEASEAENDFREKWRDAQINASDFASKLEMSQNQLELASLRERQTEIRYNTMGEPLSVYLDGEKGVRDAKKNVIMKTLEYDLSKLNLRHLADDMVSKYVDENSIKNSEEKY
jgi:outer membrane protein TolC